MMHDLNIWPWATDAQPCTHSVHRHLIYTPWECASASESLPFLSSSQCHSSSFNPWGYYVGQRRRSTRNGYGASANLRMQVRVRTWVEVLQSKQTNSPPLTLGRFPFTHEVLLHVNRKLDWKTLLNHYICNVPFLGRLWALLRSNSETWKNPRLSHN